MRDKAAALQRDLVAQLQASGALTQPAVVEAFRAVPRHLFLPDHPLDVVYADEAIATKFADGRPISSSSQPAIMAIMLEQLAVEAGQRVLEIGAGTGYNAALLGLLVGPRGEVITIDLDEDLVQAAQQHLSAAGADKIRVAQADGGFGYAPGAPYDRIILTVGAWDLAPAWHTQLVPGGRLVLPLELGPGSQQSLALVKPRDPQAVMWFESDSARECGFMRLRGALAGPEHWLELEQEAGLSLVTAGPPPAAAEAVYGWLIGAHIQTASGLSVSGPEMFGGLGLWLGLHAPNLASLNAPGDIASRLGLPCLFAFGGSPPTCFSVGLLGTQGLCLLRRPPHAPATQGEVGRGSTFELFVEAYGPAGPALANELLSHLEAWEAAGRPGTDGLRVRAYARDFAYRPAAGEIVVVKRQSQLVLDWPARPAAR